MFCIVKPYLLSKVDAEFSSEKKQSCFMFDMLEFECSVIVGGLVVFWCCTS